MKINNLITLKEHKQTLDSIIQESLMLTQALVESEGELSPEIEQRLEFNSLTLSDKIDRYGFLMEKFESEADFWKKKAAIYSKIAKAFENIPERLKERIRFALGELQKTEITGDEYRFVLSKVKSALVLNPELIPSEYKMTVTELVPDKERIRMALEEGFSISGAQLEERTALRKYVAKGDK